MSIYIEERTVVEKSVHMFELTFSPLLANGGLLHGTCKVCHVDYITFLIIFKG